MVSKRGYFVSLVCVLVMVHRAIAGDPDIISDFVVSQANSTAVDANFFTYTGLRSLASGDEPTTFKVTKASLAEFPALNGQSVSMAVLDFPAGSVNPPHTHPRSAEFLFLIDGTLVVGFVDTTNKLYTQTLQEGDMFVFPKGLSHYQYNPSNSSAQAVSAFGSASAGTVSIPTTVFNTAIDDNILALSFKTDVATIQAIRSGLATKA